LFPLAPTELSLGFAQLTETQIEPSGEALPTVMNPVWLVAPSVNETPDTVLVVTAAQMAAPVPSFGEPQL
jgi:hypothetical protein